MRQTLLSLYLAVVGLTTLLGFLFSPLERLSQAHLFVGVLSLLLWGLVRVRALGGVIVHTLTALTALLTVYTATQTGGIHSVAGVWLHVLSVPVLLLQGRAAALVWMGIVLALTLGLAGLTGTGWVSVPQTPSPLVSWAWLNQVLALLNLLLGIRIYEHLHWGPLHKRLRRHEERQATHLARIQTQTERDAFVAAVGHELRTPMNAILGFNGVLHREFADDPEPLAMAEHIRAASQQLLHKVNDLLDFSQLQAGKLRLNPVDYALQGLLDELHQGHAHHARGKGLALLMQVDGALPRRVHGDRQRLLQILDKLVDNALRHTTEGAVTVRLLVHAEGMRLEVQDTGPGIAPAPQRQLFGRFEPAHAQNLLLQGRTGLGLALCEKLVALQGGHMGVQSPPGQGALFWLQVPLQAAREPEPAPEATHDGLADEALCMLVVDDNPVNLMVAQLQLQKCWPRGHIVTANSGAQALALMGTQVFDVALVDMVMPDMDGLALTRQIRRQWPVGVARMPILALTANAQPEDRDRCLAAGMDEVLGKPVQPDQLLRTVARFLRLAREGAL